ncbi:hypothetical protein GPL17_27695 [Bradyrhizobium yuanmingense]|uniref:hypothetical protein n=1 Tax=Bradyrhizobium yuanmingense TaxID=108015 RepID=UPI0012F87AE4|nr:hypothetical protein [Bradyrhizobium yuanmingense]MVT54244.1 hypothetical protein [Bradyrhizobium yuanmingense]
MTEETNVPERKLRHDCTQELDTVMESIAASAPMNNPAWHINRPPGSPWPIKAEDVSPLAWWRTLPSDVYRDAEQLVLRTVVKHIGVLHGGGDLKAALAGDAAAAIDVAFTLMPIEKTTLAVDIAMTALCRCALAPNASAALVMAQVLGLTNLDHGFGTELAASWYCYGLRHSTDPRKFSEAEGVLLKSFVERHHRGESA